MLIGGDDCSNDIITLGTCFSMFVHICARFRFSLIGGNLTGQSPGAAGELEVEFKFQRPSCKLAGYGIHSVKSRIQDCLGYMLWLPIIQSCFTLGTRDFSCLASSFGLYGDLCKAIDVPARGLSRNIPLRAPFGTQGRLAIPFVHIFIIKERYSILKQTFATLHRSCARYNFFVFSRTLTSVRAKRARHPRFFYLYTSSRRYLNGK